MRFFKNISSPFSRWMPTSIPRSVLLATLIQMALGAGALISWRVTGVLAIVVDFFHYEGALFFVLVSAVELWLSYYCWRQFSKGESIGAAWRWIVSASVAHFTGMVLSQILGIESYLNPLVYAHVSHNAALLESIRQIGLILGGPVQMVLLARGLWLLLQVYRQSGLFSKLTRSDWFLIAVLTAYTVRETWQVAFLLRAGKTFTVSEAILWASNSLLILLLIEAICIRRSLLSMGWGLIARCWAAFAAAIALTALGDIGIWATWNGYLPWPWSSMGWYVWFLASGAYALGPAYQVQAFRSIIRRAHREYPPEHFEAGVQAI
jgi:hypothetical protein